MEIPNVKNVRVNITYYVDQEYGGEASLYFILKKLPPVKHKKLLLKKIL